MNILCHFRQKHGNEYGITHIGIFGSVARGEHTEESDVDVLVRAPDTNANSQQAVAQILKPEQRSLQRS